MPVQAPRPEEGALSAVSTSLFPEALADAEGFSRSESNPLCRGVGPGMACEEDSRIESLKV